MVLTSVLRMLLVIAILRSFLSVLIQGTLFRINLPSTFSDSIVGAFDIKLVYFARYMMGRLLGKNTTGWQVKEDKI